MQPKVASLSSDFLFPKLHGMWARSLVGAALQRLVQDSNAEAIERALAPLGIEVTHRMDVQRQLVRRHVAELSTVQRLADPHTARFYGAFLDRHFFDDLKTILHYRCFPEHDVSIGVLLVDAAELPHLDAAALLSARDASQLFGLLPDHPSREGLLPLLLEIEASRDLMYADGRLDRLFYAALDRAAGHLPQSQCIAGRRLVRTEIDISNLVMVMRNLLVYRLSAAALWQSCLPDGLLLNAECLEALVGCPDRASMMALLPPPYRSLLEPLLEAELHVSENALWNHLYRLAHDDFTDYNRPAVSLVAFAFLKRFETLNLARVFEGVHFGLGAASIREMLIGASHA